MTTAITGRLSERTMLADLTIRKWTAVKSDKRVSNEVAQNHNSDRDMGDYRKSLLAKDALAAINAFSTEARTTLKDRTLPWGNSDLRIFLSADFLDITEMIRRFQDRWEVLVRNFIVGYPDYMDDAKRRLNGLFDPAEYPDPRDIGRKFAFGVNFLPTPDQSDYERIMNVSPAQVTLIKQQAAMQERDMIEAAMADVQERITKAVGHMADRLRDYNPANKREAPFRDTLVDNLRDLVVLLPSLNIAANPRLDDLTERIKGDLLKHNAETLRVAGNVRAETEQAARDIISHMSDYF